MPNPAHGLHALVDPEDQEDSEAQTVLDLAIPLLEEAAGAPVEGMVGDPSPMNAIQDAINLHGFDEVIISTLPARVSKWLKLDLPSKVTGLGLPVTTVTARDRASATVPSGRVARGPARHGRRGRAGRAAPARSTRTRARPTAARPGAKARDLGRLRRARAARPCSVAS